MNMSCLSLNYKGNENLEVQALKYLPRFSKSSDGNGDNKGFLRESRYSSISVSLFTVNQRKTIRNTRYKK